jgi:hypothetical protein
MFDWLKKKKEQITAPKKTYRLVHHEQTFNVGIATVLVIFRDGREIHAKFYGYVDQYISSSWHVNGNVSPVYRVEGKEAARHFLRNLNMNEESKFLDDPINPTCGWSGLVAHFEILDEQQDHIVTYNVARAEEVDGNVQEG